MATKQYDEYAATTLLPVRRNCSLRDAPHTKLSQLSGVIQGEFVTRQPLHIGTGVLSPPPVASEIQLVKGFYRLNGERAVPGSSLKGAIRSLIESFTFSCIPTDRGGRHRGCQVKQFSQDKVCLACKLFGSMGYEGNVYFRVANQVDGSDRVLSIPAQHSHRNKPNERRYYPHHTYQTQPEEWPLEVVTAGSRFTLHVTYQNLSQAELGVLLIGLGATGIRPKLGAAKNARLGAVEFRGGDNTPLDVSQIEPAKAYRQLETVYTPVSVAECLEAAQALIDSSTLAGLERDLGEQALKR